MKRKRAFIIIMTIIVCMLVPQQTAAAQVKAASLVEIRGDVYVKKGGGLREFKAFENMLIEEGDQVRTGSDSSAVITYENGSQTLLSSNTETVLKRLETDEDTNRTSIRLLAGTVWNKIMKMLKPSDSYEVETPTTVMGVRGTLFLVGSNQEGVSLEVAEGTVVSTANAQSSGNSSNYLVNTGSSLDYSTSGRTAGKKQLQVKQLVEKTEPLVLAHMVSDIVERAGDIKGKTEEDIVLAGDNEGAVRALEQAVKADALVGFAQEVIDNVEKSSKQGLAQSFKEELKKSKNLDFEVLKENIKEKKEETRLVKNKAEEKYTEQKNNNSGQTNAAKEKSSSGNNANNGNNTNNGNNDKSNTQGNGQGNNSHKDSKDNGNSKNGASGNGNSNNSNNGNNGNGKSKNK